MNPKRLKQWVTGPKGGRFYVLESGMKVYGKEAEEAAAADRKLTEGRLRRVTATKDMVKQLEPGAGFERLAAVRKSGVDMMAGLGISRSAMPQIRSGDAPAFLDHLRASGIHVEETTVRVGDFKPTQNELSKKISAQLEERSGPKPPIIVTSDGHVLDGHHRWAQALTNDPNAQIPAIVIHAPIERALRAAYEFPKTELQAIPKDPPRGPDGRIQIPNVDHWEAHYDHFPAETWQVTMTGNPGKDPNAVAKPWRQPFHDAIIKQYDDVPSHPAGERIAILTMGGTASGKTTTAERIMKEKSLDRMVVSDPDSVKEQDPIYRAATGLDWQRGDGPRVACRDAGSMQHEESSYLAKKIRDRAIERGQNVLIDASGADIGKMKSQIDTLKSKGYHVHVVYVDLPVEQALERNPVRAQKGGRFVPAGPPPPGTPYLLQEGNASARANFQAVSKMADSVDLYDSSGPEGSKARAIYQRGSLTQDDAKEERIHDPAWYDEFKRKNFK